MATESDRILTHRACVRCGYDLCGLKIGQPCPECGVPVSASAGRQNLQYAAPHWLRSLRAGLTLLLASLGILGGLWVPWFVLTLAEINMRGAPVVAEALVRPFLGISLICAVMGVFGALLAFRRDPADRQAHRGPNARSISMVLAVSSGAAGVLAFAPGLFGGLAGPLVLIGLAVCLSGLSLSAIPVLAALVRRSPARKHASPRALAVVVAGTEVLLLVYAAGLTLLPRTPFVGNYVAALIFVLIIAIPASALFYVQFLWQVLQSVRAALAMQARLPTDQAPEA